MFDFSGLRGSKAILFPIYPQLEVEAKTLELSDPSPHQRVCAWRRGLFMKLWLLCL